MFDFNDKKKKIIAICAAVYAVLVLLFVLIVNFDKFSAWGTWINQKFDVFTPIIIGAILAYLCTPLVRFFQNIALKKMKNKRAKRGLSIFLTCISVIGIVFAFVALIIPQLLSSAEEFLKKMTDGTYLNNAIESVNNILNNLLTSRGEEQFEFIDKQKIIDYIRKFFNNSGTIFQQLGNFVLAYASNFVISIKNIFLGFLISVYFLIFKERIYAQTQKLMRAVLPKKKCESLSAWASYADTTFGGFVVGKLIDALFMTVACSIVFGIAGIPYTVLISVIIGISNIIPFFGPFIGAIPSGFIVLIASDTSKLLLFVVLLLLIQQFDANVMEPKIVGDKTGLTSLGVIVAVLIMSGYFGILGTFFGVPIYAILCSLIRGWVDGGLKKKELSTELADYYPENSLVNPRETTEKKSRNIFHLIGIFFAFLFRKIKKLFAFFAAKSKAKKRHNEENKNNEDEK